MYTPLPSLFDTTSFSLVKMDSINSSFTCGFLAKTFINTSDPTWIWFNSQMADKTIPGLAMQS